MKYIGIIPARYASTRFPGKSLAMINGKSMIQRVYEQASGSATLSYLVVATDDVRIEDHVRSFGGKVIMTSPLHKSGTDRCHEAIQKIVASDPVHNRFDVILNIQGDEPYLNPAQIDQVIGCFNNPSVTIATLMKKIDSSHELFDPNVVKVIIDASGNAIYFSRQPIPFLRDIKQTEWLQRHDFFKHTGIYAFRAEILNEIVKLAPSSLENAEALEQLRWLENNYSIYVQLTEYENISVDIPEDLSKFTNMS
ncbi:MAG: 3-deoxy-manno-octulosonate cytidylyltransferase [Bacteroidetes bacterium]|nr:3-deoxy-manno-octulosonate cytidylyltransferase [Bacteroidota bacterium]